MKRIAFAIGVIVFVVLWAGALSKLHAEAGWGGMKREHPLREIPRDDCVNNSLDYCYNI